MTQATDISTTLKTLMERDPTLPFKLKTLSDTDQVRRLILQSAEQHEMQIDAGALDEYLQSAARQAEILTTLISMTTADPGLKAALKQSTQVDEAVGHIMASADRQGITLDADELAAYVQIAPQDDIQEISDEDLADVTGGVMVVGMVICGAMLVGLAAGAAGLGFGIGVIVGPSLTNKK